MQQANPVFLDGGGETGAIIRSINWADTPLGNYDQWPPGLCTALSIILNSHFPMFLFWGPHLICFYNDAYRPSLGNEGKHPAAMGRPAAEVWPEIWADIKPQIDQVMSGGEATWHEDQLLPIFRNGQMEEVYWTYSYSAVKDETGKVSGVFVTCNETTEKVKAGQDLKKAYEEKNQILESISDGFFVTDRNWTVTYWNQQAEKITGVKRDTIIGKNLWHIFSNAIDTPFYTFYLDAVRQNKPGTIEEFFAPLDVWVEETIYPSPQGCSVYIKDITLRKKQEASLNQLTGELSKKAEDLEAQNAELQQFVYAVSHDLKEPLRMVSNFLKLLENKYAGKLDDTAQQYIHFATDGAVRMRILIDDLLEYSRASRLQPEKTEVDTAQLLADIIKQHQPLLDEKEATIHYKELPVVYADRTRLRQVFQNLITNALKYQPPGRKPVVEITGEKKNNRWQFSVTDNGIGIEKAYFDKIFMIFQRLHNRTEYPGTGIGLALCKKIVEQHGGRIWVESEPGKGSTFYFTLLQ
jgi:PAS domain S-box-containing protein